MSNKLELFNKNQDLVSTTELAKQLHTTNDVVLDVARRSGIKKKIKNGVSTYWNEKEASVIIKNIQYNNPNAKSPLTQTKGKLQTSISIKENFLKATQDYIALIESEKQQLKEENERQKCIIEQQKETLQKQELENRTLIKKQELITKTSEEKYTTKELWVVIEKLIKTRAQSLFLI